MEGFLSFSVAEHDTNKGRNLYGLFKNTHMETERTSGMPWPILRINDRHATKMLYLLSGPGNKRIVERGTIESAAAIKLQSIKALAIDRMPMFTI